jgi:hypothetical protein
MALTLGDTSSMETWKQTLTRDGVEVVPPGYQSDANTRR